MSLLELYYKVLRPIFAGPFVTVGGAYQDEHGTEIVWVGGPL